MSAARGPGRRARARCLGFGLATVLGVRRLGFFIPYRYAAAVQAQGYPALEPLFVEREAAFLEVLDAIEAEAPRLRALDGPAPAPRFDQGWFPRLDAAAAYAMVCRARPARIVEVGSGHSTRFLARAVRDQGLATAITCIDPAPRASLAGLPIRWRRCVVQRAPLDDFRALAAADMLFVDSSHVLMPGSDVDHLIGTVLPLLAPGVLVHVHDVFLPDPYPEAWAWRGYNEQGAIAALLQGGAYALRFASHHLASRRAGRLRRGLLSSRTRPPASRAASGSRRSAEDARAQPPRMRCRSRFRARQTLERSPRSTS